MIVIDASCVVELLIGTAAGAQVAARILRPAETLHAPHLLDVEVAHALRSLVRARALGPRRADDALSDFLAMRLSRHPHGALLPRVWSLRHSLTAYDAMYVSLAEALGAPLLTRDGRLARAHGHEARVELI